MPDVIAETAVAAAYDGEADDTGFLDHGGAGVGAGGDDEPPGFGKVLLHFLPAEGSHPFHAGQVAGAEFGLRWAVAEDPQGPGAAGEEFEGVEEDIHAFAAVDGARERDHGMFRVGVPGHVIERGVDAIVHDTHIEAGDDAVDLLGAPGGFAGDHIRLAEAAGFLALEATVNPGGFPDLVEDGEAALDGEDLGNAEILEDGGIHPLGAPGVDDIRLEIAEDSAEDAAGKVLAEQEVELVVGLGETQERLVPVTVGLRAFYQMIKGDPGDFQFRVFQKRIRKRWEPGGAMAAASALGIAAGGVPRDVGEDRHMEGRIHPNRGISNADERVPRDARESGCKNDFTGGNRGNGGASRR